MQVSDILENKGGRIVSIGADLPVGDIAVVLKNERIGAAVVLNEQQVSERDIVRAVAEQGEGALRLKAADLMTSSVVTCSPESSTSEIMEQMIEGQIRHLPVSQNGSMVGIISIGDVVKAVHGELNWMTKVLHNQVVTAAGWATDES
jgi:CBS domain-containing protein